MRAKKREFSKIIIAIVGTATGDTSPLAYLIPAIFAELATATGFYYSKAKAENRIKLRKKYGPDIYNDSKED